jgi:GntR family transcriptional regulator/GntR family frlABCD operon transcriptional regulator
MEKIPQYQKLFQTLKNQIISGNYKTGDLLPSENELSFQYKLTRVTVRQALNELVKQSLISKHQGKGSIVTYDVENLDLLSFRGFTEVMGATSHQTKTIFLKKPYLTNWGEDFFYELSEAEKKVACIRLDRLRLVDEIPVMIEFTFLPSTNLPDFMGQALVNDSLFNTLHIKYQIDIQNVSQKLRAIKADKEVADFLNLELGEPILLIYRKYSTNRKDFFVYSILYCNTELYTIGSNFS